MPETTQLPYDWALPWSAWRPKEASWQTHRHGCLRSTQIRFLLAQVSSLCSSVGDLNIFGTCLVETRNRKPLRPNPLALSTHPEFMKLVKSARAEFRAGRTVSLEEMRARLGRGRSVVRLMPVADSPDMSYLTFIGWWLSIGNTL